MSEKRVKVEREVSEREIKVERENVVSVYATGIFPSGTKSIEENGTYDVTADKYVEVAVPQPEGTINITENGTHDVKDYETAAVAVPVMTDEDVFATTLSNVDLKFSMKRVVFHEKAMALTRMDFYGMTNLEYADLSGMDVSNVITLQSVFGNDTNLKFLNISGWTNPNHVVTTQMFLNCAKLETLIIDSEEVFYNNYPNSLQGMNATCLIYVPDELVNAYKAHAVWGTRASYIKPLSELPANAGA